MPSWHIVSGKKCKECGQTVPPTEDEFRRVSWWRRLLFYMTC